MFKIKTFTMKKLFLLLCMFPAYCFAASLLTSNQSNISNVQLWKTTEVLPVEKAFAIEANMKQKDMIEVKIATEPGYKLYRDKLYFFTKSATLGNFTLPEGKMETIAALGEKLTIYDGFYTVLLPVKGQKKFTLYVQAQGCAQVGVCYPPFKKTFDLVNK